MTDWTGVHGIDCRSKFGEPCECGAEEPDVSREVERAMTAFYRKLAEIRQEEIVRLQRIIAALNGPGAR